MVDRRRHPAPLLLTIAILGGCASPGASAPPAATGAGPTQTGAQGTAQPPSPTAEAPTPAITGLTGRVVFARADDQYGEETTFEMNIDGSDEHQIGELGQSGFPWVTPDGSKVSVGTDVNGRIGSLIFDLDGTNRYVVPEPDDLMFGSAPLTADGKHVVAETFTSPGFEYAGHNVVEVATGKMHKLVDDRHYISGDISPDGSKVLLFLNDPKPDPPAPGSIWVVGLDGKGLRQVTPDGLAVQCCMNYRWSPDGRTILFASPAGGIWTIGVDGSNPTEIFHQDGKWAITPTYSPDGSMILFPLDPSQNPFRHPTNDLYVIRADGSDLTLVFGDGTFKREPTWVP